MLKYSILMISMLLIAVQSMAQGQNVMIGNSNSPNEPSICINPNNPMEIVAAANIDNLYYSHDGGKTWTEKKMESPYGVWGDPVIGVDTSGSFYYFHLSNPEDGNWIDRIVCQRSDDAGVTWTEGTYAGLNGKKAQDKHWCAVDRRNNKIYLTWTQFDEYGSKKKKHKSLILFSSSDDKGETWSDASRISETPGDCIDDDNTVEGAVPCVGPNGEIYVAFAGPEGLVFDRSMDEGKTWLEKDVFIDAMPGGWNLDIPGIYRCNGMPVTVCDVSGGANNGTVYVSWADQKNGEHDTDVWLSKSTDKGNTWAKPVRVNDDPAGKQQFFQWMTIDQTNGYIYLVFYDRREHHGSETDVYLAVSTNGGDTFSNHKISEESFLPNPYIFMGDYNNISVHNGIIRPIWTRLHEGKLSIWTSLLKYSDLIRE